MNGDAVQVQYKCNLMNSTWPVAQPRLARGPTTAVQKQPRLCFRRRRCQGGVPGVCDSVSAHPPTGARHSRPLMSGCQVACLEGSSSQVAPTSCK